MLVELLQRHRSFGKETVHVGFAGGHSMRKMSQCLAQALRQPTEGLPSTVVFHAMVSGCDVTEPSTDPNAFFTYFVKDQALQVEPEFVALHAPIVVESRQYAGLRALKGIAEAYERAKELDIIVTSGACWDDPHSMLRQYSEQSPQSLETLRKAGCVGDMLWRPLGRSGPILDETEIRAMALVELTDLPQFIKDGRHVLLMLGPCMGQECNKPKPELLELVLRLEPRLITHLVVDSLTAGSVFKPDWGA
jgi:DNA-binding transcriptional regulator LsrR (DeoR family)